MNTNYYVIAATRKGSQNGFEYLSHASVIMPTDQPRFAELNTAYQFKSAHKAIENMANIKLPDWLEDMHVRHIENTRVN